MKARKPIRGGARFFLPWLPSNESLKSQARKGQGRTEGHRDAGIREYGCSWAGDCLAGEETALSLLDSLCWWVGGVVTPPTSPPPPPAAACNCPKSFGFIGPQGHGQLPGALCLRIGPAWGESMCQLFCRLLWHLSVPGSALVTGHRLCNLVSSSIRSTLRSSTAIHSPV